MPTAFTTFLKQGFLYPIRFLGGRLQKPTISKEELKPGEGAIVEINGQKVAAYKDNDGKILTLSPVCRHMGCIVGWNSNDKTWDCPCHGSRYEADGTLKGGPAQKNLKWLLIGRMFFI